MVESETEEVIKQQILSSGDTRFLIGYSIGKGALTGTLSALNAIKTARNERPFITVNSVIDILQEYVETYSEVVEEMEGYDERYGS